MPSQVSKIEARVYSNKNPRFTEFQIQRQPWNVKEVRWLPFALPFFNMVFQRCCHISSFSMIIEALETSSLTHHFSIGLLLISVWYSLERKVCICLNSSSGLRSDRCMYISLCKYMGWCLHPRSIFFKTLKRPESSFNRGIDGGYTLTPIQLIPICQSICACMNWVLWILWNCKYLATLIRTLEGKFQHLDSWDNL